MRRMLAAALHLLIHPYLFFAAAPWLIRWAAAFFRSITPPE